MFLFFCQIIILQKVVVAVKMPIIFGLIKIFKNIFFGDILDGRVSPPLDPP